MGLKDKKSLPADKGGEVQTETAKINTDSRFAAVFTGSCVFLIVLFGVTLSLGRYRVPVAQSVRILLSRVFRMNIETTWTEIQEAVIMTLRLPRSVAAVLIGAALALSGATYQSIFKNPMVSPDLLGVSSGACVGAALAILLDGGAWQIQLFAFVFGAGTVFLTTLIPKLIRNNSTTILVLSGVIVSSLMSSVMSIIKSLADTDTKLAEITYWTMGSLATVDFKGIMSVVLTIVIPMAVILVMRYRLNVLALGDDEAKTLGINIQKTRGVFIACSTLITASCVCLAGTIGWIGLVIPHVSRLIIGADNKKMLPIALTFGGAFMLVIDTLCRTLSSAELKIGVLTGIIGAPFFLFILIKQSKMIR